MLTNTPVHAKAPAASAVIGESGLVHGYLTYQVSTRSAKELFTLWKSIASFRPQVVVYLASPRGGSTLTRDRIFFRLCGAGRIIGLPEGDLAEPLYDPATGMWEHESARLVRCLKCLGQKPGSESTEISLEDWDLNLTRNELVVGAAAVEPLGGRPLLACGPGTKMQAKDWGPENWRLLLKQVSQQIPNLGLAMIGAQEDHAVSAFASQDWNGPVVNLCGTLTPRETAAVLKQALCFLGPDSGPMHLAAAYGVPCIAAFASRARPGMWFPAGEGHKVAFHWIECSGCNLETCVVNKRRCLSLISVQEMFQNTIEVLNTRLPAGRRV